MKKEKSWRKYLYWFHHKMDKEIWNILPWRAKFGLIFLDVIINVFIICGIIVLIKKFVFNCVTVITLEL